MPFILYICGCATFLVETRGHIIPQEKQSYCVRRKDCRFRCLLWLHQKLNPYLCCSLFIFSLGVVFALAITVTFTKTFNIKNDDRELFAILSLSIFGFLLLQAIDVFLLWVMQAKHKPAQARSGRSSQDNIEMMSIASTSERPPQVDRTSVSSVFGSGFNTSSSSLLPRNTGLDRGAAPGGPPRTSAMRSPSMSGQIARPPSLTQATSDQSTSRNLSRASLTRARSSPPNLVSARGVHRQGRSRLSSRPASRTRSSKVARRRPSASSLSTFHTSSIRRARSPSRSASHNPSVNRAAVGRGYLVCFQDEVLAGDRLRRHFQGQKALIGARLTLQRDPGLQVLSCQTLRHWWMMAASLPDSHQVPWADIQTIKQFQDSDLAAQLVALLPPWSSPTLMKMATKSAWLSPKVKIKAVVVSISFVSERRLRTILFYQALTVTFKYEWRTT